MCGDWSIHMIRVLGKYIIMNYSDLETDSSATIKSEDIIEVVNHKIPKLMVHIKGKM